MKNLNVLVCGAGAVGMFFGGKFSSTGAQVTILERPEKVEALEGQELEVITKYGNKYSYVPRFVDDLLDTEPQDLVLVCVKGFATYDVALKLLPVLKPSTIVLSLQNGLENEQVLADLLGENMVIGVVHHYSGDLLNETTVEQHAPANIVFGELNHTPSNREEWLSQILSHADISHRISRKIKVEIWKKFLWNSVFNPITTLTNSALTEVYQSHGLKPTIQSMFQEGLKIAQSEGIEISSNSLEELQKPLDGFEQIKTSMLKDFRAGKTLELDSLLGEVVKKAHKHNVPAPISESIYELTKLLVQSRAL